MILLMQALHHESDLFPRSDSGGSELPDSPTLA